METVNPDAISAIVVAVLGIGAVGLQYGWRRDRRRDRARQDLHLLHDLPEESGVRQELLAHIDGQIRDVIASEAEMTRSMTGVTLAIVFLAGGGWLIYLAIADRGWWYLTLAAAIPIVMLGAVGLSQDSRRRRRDDRGRPLET